MKMCRTCKEIKDISEYYIYKQSCKKCLKIKALNRSKVKLDPISLKFEIGNKSVNNTI